MSQHMVTPDDEKKAAGVQGKADKTFNNAVKSMKEMVSLSEKFAKNYEKAAKAMAEATGGKYTGSSKLGLGQFTRNQQIAGGVVIGAAAAGSLFMGMAPNTMAAVGQRMSLDTYAGLSGMSTRQALGLANRQVGNGATSAMGPSKAAMTASYSGGYLASTLSSRNIMQSVGGLSAITGGSNEQVAQGLSAMNGMNFLRMGVSIRDSRGQLKPTNQIINDTYRFLYGGKSITPEQAQMVFNPNSKGYQTLAAVAGGDPGLLQILQSGIVARANNKKNLTKSDLNNSNKALDIMKVEKSSPLRAQFRYNTSEARKLQATESGLVGGYNVALRTTASVNDGFSGLAETLPAVTQALMTFKGALQTFPGAGNTGATLSNIGGAVAGGAMNIGQMMLAGKLLGVGGGGPKLGSVLSRGGSLLSGSLGKAVPVLGTLLSAYGGYKSGKSKGKFSWAEVLKSAGMGAAGGAAVGAMGAGVGAAPGALIGALLAGGGNAIGQMFGKGGDNCGHGNIGAHSCGMGGDNAASSPNALRYQSPVPPGTMITSGFGPRDNSKNPQISSNHSGVDYGVAVGTSIVSAADGVVTETGLHRQYGNYVIIRHGDKSTLYGHLSQILVRKGEKVSQGYVIGKSGGKKGSPGAGTSTGPHLHFEVRNNGGVGAKGRQNPLGILGKAWNIIKNVAGAGIKAVGNLFGMAKKIPNGQGSDFSFNVGKEGLSSLSSSNLGSLLSSSISSGKPISWDDVSGQVNGETKVGLGRKGQHGRAYLNNSYDATPGDSQGMTGGSRAGLMKMLYAKGFRGKALHTAFAVALAESGGRADAVGDKNLVTDKWGPSYGAFQIRSLNNWKKYNDPYRDASRLKNGSFNLDAAFKKSNGGNSWKGWSTFTSGGFTKYLDDASKAASAAGFGKGGGDTEGTGSTAGMALSTSGMAGAVGGRSSSTSTLSTNSKVDINVTMNVNIAKASHQEVQVLMETFSNKLETELRLKGIGTY